MKLRVSFMVDILYVACGCVISCCKPCFIIIIFYILCTVLCVMSRSEFEKTASALVKELSDTNERKSQKLVKRPLETWNDSNAFELADSGRLMEFMKQDCCQTKIDKMWRGKLEYIAMWQVRVLYISQFHYLNIPITVIITLFVDVKKATDRSKASNHKAKASNMPRPRM